MQIAQLYSPKVLETSFDSQNGDIGVVMVYLGKSGKTRGFMARMDTIPESLLETSNPFEVEIFGVNVVFCHPFSIFPTISLTENNNGKEIGAIGNYLSLLFGTKIDNRLKMFYDFPENILSIPPAVTDVIIHGGNNSIRAEILERVYSNFPFSNSSYIVPNIQGKLREDSHIFEIQHLHLLNAFWQTTDILYHFKGKTVTLYEAKCRESAIIHFVEKWISNEEFQNMEWIKIKMNEDFRLNPEKIFKNFVTRRWEPMERPDTYSMKSLSINLTSISGPLLFQTVDDHVIEQNGTGIIASIQCRPDFFSFFVWQKF